MRARQAWLLGGTVLLALSLCSTVATAAKKKGRPAGDGDTSLPLAAPPPSPANPAPLDQDLPLVSVQRDKTDKKRGDERNGRGGLVAIKVGGMFGAEEALRPGFVVAVEGGYRLPFADRLLGLSLEPNLGFAGGQVTRAIGAETLSAWWVDIPLLLSGNFAAGDGWLRVLAGPAFDWLSSSGKLGAYTVATSGTTWGATAGASYSYPVGPGALGVEARYRYLSYTAPDALVARHGFTVSAGYLFSL